MENIPVDIKDNIWDLIVHIKRCNHDIKQLQVDKEKSEQALKAYFGHYQPCQKTYDYSNGHNDLKIIITTGFTHTLNKTKYMDFINCETSPLLKYPLVKEVVKLELDLKACSACDQYGTTEEKYIKSLFVTTTDKKLKIDIKDTKKNEKTVNSIAAIDFNFL